MLSTVANAVCQLLLKHVCIMLAMCERQNAFHADETFGCMAKYVYSFQPFVGVLWWKIGSISLWLAKFNCS